MHKSEARFHRLASNRHRLHMALIMFLADLIGFITASFLVFMIGIWSNLYIFKVEDLRYLVIVSMTLILYASSKLYPGVGLNPVDEIRLIFNYTWLGTLLSFAMFSLTQMSWLSNYWIFFLLGGFSIPLILFFRWVLRIISRRLKIWGVPVVVVGSAENANRLANYFLSRRRLGFIPERIINLEGNQQQINAPVIVFDKNQLAIAHLPNTTSNSQIHTALIDITDATHPSNQQIINDISHSFPHLIFVSNMTWMSGASMQTHDFEGMSGVEAKKSTLSPLEILIKRGLDIVLSISIGILTSPIWLLAVLLIPLDSPGPAFYTQERIGKDRRQRERPGKHKRRVVIYKFRTMVVNADQILANHLAQNEEARLEWEKHQKLRNDPRITRLGIWLRKFSIDELPQLLNVIKGDMSLVGPRPLPDYHHELFPYEKQKVRDKIKPGLTGMWQVSGRSNSDIRDMELWDLYYIHNWSVWLDIYIILRTAWVVLTRDGAY
jgi:Undecaprenyl-phosphate galactose phosphotransferase WbaP